jgi:hypothetical protein
MALDITNNLSNFTFHVLTILEVLCTDGKSTVIQMDLSSGQLHLLGDRQHGRRTYQL